MLDGYIYIILLATKSARSANNVVALVHRLKVTSIFTFCNDTVNIPRYQFGVAGYHSIANLPLQRVTYS